ncbi:uncharacterized protein BP5553_08067 [Venustampulla echinocandica]|uniref:Uncharacterized protein n=1 Tax=Venustampulla echinocandica TaxID=2656787 RepID=A0A370TFM4_9HELO|nr:uncharacterized protein BP5553_08067 [Venustampulla echinocandica]RDL33699.1 hypothetical protein BP5553_08067 [Venustampulla echinocandica]
MANGWSVIIGLVIVVLACLAGWFFAPKGETQTYALRPFLLFIHVIFLRRKLANNFAASGEAR